MASEIVHETEVHRQHVRLRIPIAIEIDGQRYTVDDWSLGGFGVLGTLPRRRPGERFRTRLHLPFEDFELGLETEAELVYRLEDESRFGCKFVGLAAGQLALFRYVVDAYLSGEIVNAGDLLAVRARAAGGGPSAGRAVVEREGRGPLALLARVGAVLLFLAAAGGLAALAWAGARERWFTVRAEAAIVETPVVRVTAPAAGRLRPGELDPVVAIGAAIAAVQSEGGELPVTSPCECALVEWLAAAGERVEAGQPVALLAAADRPLLVRASVPVRAGGRLAVGDPAQIQLPGGGTVRGRVERIDLRPQLLGLASGDPVAAARRPLSVVVRPDRPLDFGLLGTPVEVRFR